MIPLDKMTAKDKVDFKKRKRSRRVGDVRALLTTLLFACAAPAPRTVATAPSMICPQQPAVSPAACRCVLPPIPEIPVAVGYPSADTIFVTTSDFEALAQALTRMRAWMRAAAACLGSPVN
jgi:hypothetical protein